MSGGSGESSLGFPTAFPQTDSRLSPKAPHWTRVGDQPEPGRRVHQGCFPGRMGGSGCWWRGVPRPGPQGPPPPPRPAPAFPSPSCYVLGWAGTAAAVISPAQPPVTGTFLSTLEPIQETTPSASHDSASPAHATPASLGDPGHRNGGDVPACSSLRSPTRSVCKACWDSESSPRQPVLWLVGSQKGELQAGQRLDTRNRVEIIEASSLPPITDPGLGMNQETLSQERFDILFKSLKKHPYLFTQQFSV